MQGLRGSISPATLSPIEVLGIHARDQTERRRYAEHWARIMHQDAERILEFQRAYQAALARLYPGVQLVDVARLDDRTPLGADLNPGDRLLFFTRTGCARCDLVLSRLLDRVQSIGGLDIYLLGVPVGDDPAVRAWARSRAIPPDLVQTGVVTLNYDDGALARVSRGVAIPPYLLRQRGETLSVIQIDGS
jgi:integrating conjugative element protein (TIGR03759 family)